MVATMTDAQNVLTLEECLRIGLENNLSLRQSRNDIVSGKHNISENRARLLPQINAVVGFNDNFTPPVSVTDGSAYGKPYNVTKTLQYNASASLQLSMPLYSQTALTAVQIAKTLDGLNQLSYEKAREDLIMQIAKIYYLIQNTTEQINIVGDNLRRFGELKGIAQAFYDNQMAMQVDIKSINVRIETTDLSLSNAKAMLKEQYNMLKYVLDYPVEEDFLVEEKRVDDVSSAAMSGLSMNLTELQMVQSQSRLADQQVRLAKNGYLPTLALTGNFTFSAFTDKFKNWFHEGESNHWYDSNGIGVSLRIPVFDSFEKRSKIRKAKIAAENARISYENTLKGMQTQYNTAVNDHLNNERNYKKQRENYLLAEDVYKVTADRYKEGVTSMIEVLQDEMSMSEAQNNYLTAHYNYQVSNLNILKLTGSLDSLLR